jgi:hypothetical protein
MSGQSQPPARAGHTCSVWDGQMVVVGGYVGKEISCDSPGIYNFNLSSLSWTSSFTSLSSSDSSDSRDSSAVSSFQGSLGSYGYVVPPAVQAVIGGGPEGGATVTTPASGPATAGPLATGHPPTFTVTQSGGPTVIQTSTATSTATPPAAKSGSNAGVISASVVAGVLAALAGYLAFCTWLYRRQLKLYKNHVAMAQRTAFTGSPDNWESSGDNSGVETKRVNEKVGTGVMLGPFGSGRASMGTSSVGTGRVSPVHGLTSMESSSQGSGSYGGGSMPGRSYRVSEGDEMHEAHHVMGQGPQTWPGTTQSSVEDLLGGQEPSFFSVVLNPRRTLRVVNSD